MLAMRIYTSIFSVVSLLLLPWPVWAQAVKKTRIRDWLDRARDEATLPKVTALPVIAGLLKTLVGMAGIVFLILIMHAGFLWMTAQGNSEQLDKAKGSLISSTIGLIIVVGAYAITSFVVSNLVRIFTGNG